MQTRHLPVGFVAGIFLGDSKSRPWVSKLYIDSLLYVNISQRYFCQWNFQEEGGETYSLLHLFTRGKENNVGVFFVRQGHLEIGAAKQHQEEKQALPASVCPVCLSQHCGRRHYKESLLVT